MDVCILPFYYTFMCVGMVQDTVDLDGHKIGDVVGGFGQHLNTILLDATFPEVVDFFMEILRHKSRALAFEMGGHRNLGSSSEVNRLGDDLMKKILRLTLS